MKLIIKKTPKEDSDKLSIVFSALILLVFISNAAAIVENRIGISQSTISIVSKIVIALLLVYNIGAIIRSIDQKIILLLIAIGFIFVLSYLLSNDKDAFIKTITSFFISVLPVSIVISCIKKYDSLINKLYVVSITIVLLSVFVVLISDRSNTEYSMGYSNSLAIPVITLIFHYYSKRKIVDILFFTMGIIEIIMIGSRGALLGIGTFVIILVLKQMISSGKRLQGIIISSIMLLMLINFQSIIGFLYTISTHLGYNSRTLWLLSNDITHDSRRQQIYEQMLYSINSSPFKMRGIAGEYTITNGYYSHNFILELIVDFGVLFGGILVLFLLYKACFTIVKGIKYEDSYSVLLLILFSASFPEALVSGSFWTSVYLWSWLFLSLGNNAYINDFKPVELSSE